MTPTTLQRAKNYRSIVYTVGSRFQPDYKLKRKTEVIAESLEQAKHHEEKGDFYLERAYEYARKGNDNKYCYYKKKAQEHFIKQSDLENKALFIENSIE